MIPPVPHVAGWSLLLCTYLIVGAYIPSGLLLLTIVKVANPNDDRS